MLVLAPPRVPTSPLLRMPSLPAIPGDALTLSLALVCGVLLVLSFLLRRALSSRPTEARPKLPTIRWAAPLGWIERAIELLELLDAAVDGPAQEKTQLMSQVESASPQRFTLDGVAYRLPAPPPPSSAPHAPAKPGHRRSTPLSSPPFTTPAFLPPVPARPLSAAKMIMSRHTVRKPYRSPPIPGAPRKTSRSPLLVTSDC